MVVFPNAKINIGLRVTGKRDDGFHNIESIFYPIPFRDALEAIPANQTAFDLEGPEGPVDPESNTILKAYELLKGNADLPPLHFCIYKNLPTGAGLGGGSADGTFTLKLLDQLFELNLNDSDYQQLAEKLGSDCPFFLDNQPAKVTGRGEILEPVDLDLKGYHIVVVHPGISIDTGKAYQHISPKMPETPINDLVRNPIKTWGDHIHNDFEEYVLQAYPEIRDIKSRLYQKGALFALMSGSGSAVYGIFEQNPDLQNIFPENYRLWKGEL